MPPSLLALLAYALWTLSLSFVGIVLPRTLEVLGGRRKANSFQPGDDAESPWRHRVARAQLNCVENLPIFGAVVLALAVGGVADPAVDGLAVAVVGARLVQSTLHLISTSHWMVFGRGTFFIVQVGCIFAMAVRGLMVA